MALPRFSDMNGANIYTWEEYPVIPSDRADIASPITTDRYFTEYLRAEMLIGRKYLVKRGKWTLQWKAIPESMMLALQYYFELAYFRLYPDGAGASYWEVFIKNQFAPIWQPGGLYNLTLELAQYS
jgi:hypothetical protein